MTKHFYTLAKILGALVTIFGPIVGIWLYFNPPEMSNIEIVKLIAILSYLLFIMFLYIEIIRKKEVDSRTN